EGSNRHSGGFQMRFAALFLLLALSDVSYGQNVERVSFCDVAAAPEKYTDTVLRLDADVLNAFHAYVLSSKECPDRTIVLLFNRKGNEPPAVHEDYMFHNFLYEASALPAAPTPGINLHVHVEGTFLVRKWVAGSGEKREARVQLELWVSQILEFSVRNA